MAKKDYAKMFTKRKDGYYQKKVNGKYLYDRDPEALYHKWQASLQPTSHTFSEAAVIYEENARKSLGAKTWLSYRPQYQQIVSELGELPVESVTAGQIDAILNKAKLQGLSKSVIQTKRTIITQILNEALVSDWIQVNPALSVRMPRGIVRNKRHAPTDSDVQEIMRHINEPFGFMVYFLLCTGIRRGEALALHISDVDFEHREISITKAITYIPETPPIIKRPKTESSNRTVPIIDALYPYLQNYVKTVKGPVLFPEPGTKTYMGEKTFGKLMTKYREKTGLSLTAHMLRHGTATLLFEAGVDMYTTRDILGHSNINTTMQIYTELREAKKKKSLEKFNSALMPGVEKGVENAIL